MSKTLVPPAPQASFAASDRQPGIDSSASKTRPPLDAAFLRRVYISMLWFGALMTLMAAPVLHTARGIGSFVGGLLLAALMLRSQEVVVRAVLRPKEQIGGFDPRAALMLVLPFKFFVLLAGLGLLQSFKLMAVVPLALGFFAGQMVIVAKILGFILVRRNAR